MKSNTNIRPLSMPTQISPFAANTVGVLTAVEPRTACALFEGRVKTCVASTRSCVHRKTSRVSGTWPFDCGKSCFSAPGRCAEDEPGESVEKLDGEGETPRKAEGALVAEEVGEARGVYERRREIVGCRKGLRCNELGVPFGKEEDMIGGEERDADAEEGEGVKMAGCYNDKCVGGGGSGATRDERRTGVFGQTE